MGLEFWLLEGPERKKIRLFGVDIYPSDDDNVNIRRRRKPPKLIDFFSRERKRSRHCSSAARGRERAGMKRERKLLACGFLEYSIGLYIFIYILMLYLCED